MILITNCPCGQSLPYEKCCQPLHKSETQAVDAETLMRSRFSAFVKQDLEYLINTLHPKQRQPNDRRALQKTCQITKWLGLKILKAQQYGQHADVEFVAYYDDYPIGQIHEISRFVRENDKWFYVNGIFLPRLKLLRNATCVCKSGLKFKHCHGR